MGWEMPEREFGSESPLPERRRRAEAAASVRSRFHPTELATYVFIVSLGVFFASSLVAFLVIRLTGARMAAATPIALPHSLWISTVALLATSFALHRALTLVKRERQQAMRRWLFVASALGLVFLVVQGYSLFEILDIHFVSLERRMSLYGIVFFLVGLHALHVLGGMICLAIVALRSLQYRYDHECHRGLRICVVYWHFLDVVWLVMLVTLLTSG